MNKSAEAFRTIGEVAEELEIPKHVLRFWEGRFPQIRPMKRGGGRRYYRPAYGNVCVTGRGDCPTPALPYGSNCGCYIPGFGNKRGIVQ